MIIITNFLTYKRSMLKHPLIAFLKLIRLENLIIIVITQISIKYLVFSPFNEFSNFSNFDFYISLLSTVLIAAAGYIINDYFDVKTDKINRPETVVIDVTIKRRWAMIFHIVFSFIGLLLGIYLSYKCKSLAMLLFQILSILLLWFYSTHFKKQLLIGNIVVSLLTACIPVMPMAYEYYFWKQAGGFSLFFVENLIKLFVIIVMGYSGFAFLTSFAREIIKDMEDYKGDKQTGGMTMPIMWGIITSKVVVFFVLLITIGLLVLACYKFQKENQFIAIYYILIAVIVPLVFLIFKTIKANTSSDYKFASLLLKFIMLTGISFTIIIKYLYE
jgi:4-hydroxybenzoate polyprenyltransferase